MVGFRKNLPLRLGSFAWAILNICNHLPFDTRIHLPIPCARDKGWKMVDGCPVVFEKLKQNERFFGVSGRFVCSVCFWSFELDTEQTLLTLFVWHVEVLKHENKMCVLCLLLFHS